MSKLILKQIVMDILRLCFSPLIGAIEGIKAEMNRPASSNLKQMFKDDIQLYFAPITGAIAGVKKELKRRKNSSSIL